MVCQNGAEINSNQSGALTWSPLYFKWDRQFSLIMKSRRDDQPEMLDSVPALISIQEVFLLHCLVIPISDKFGLCQHLHQLNER